jgi:hypothetical protein
MTNLASIMRDHVTLSNTCIDRLYINGYIHRFQLPGGVRYFLDEHLGFPVPSPAQFHKIRERFTGQIKHFSKASDIPMIKFERGQRKDDVATGYRRRFADSEGVVFIGVAQEKEWSFRGQKVQRPGGGVDFEFPRHRVFVNQYYFYLHDRQWGPMFLKLGSYLPFPVKLCLNGHEWAKQQLLARGIGFEALDNGFLSCEEPERLEEICSSLGPQDIQDVFDRWSARLPWPLEPESRAAGYNHRLSIWQIEVSQTQVFERPVQGRRFFEALIRENLDLGRPDRVNLLFPQQHRRTTPPPPRGYRTRVIFKGVAPSLHVEYKKTHVKQYFKEERALRTETTINDPRDFKVNKGLENLPHLCDLGEQSNRKLLEIERLQGDCQLRMPTFERLQQPTRVGHQRAPAMRFGDPRTMALLEALCGFFHVPHGFRHRDLRPRVASLLGLSLEEYTPGRMTYDLRRLRLKGVIARVPKTHRYTVTTFGLKIALFFSKIYNRVLQPGWEALSEKAQPPTALKRAMERVGTVIRQLYEEAQFLPQPSKLDSLVQKLPLADV